MILPLESYGAYALTVEGGAPFGARAWSSSGLDDHNTWRGCVASGSLMRACFRRLRARLDQQELPMRRHQPPNTLSLSRV